MPISHPSEFAILCLESNGMYQVGGENVESSVYRWYLKPGDWMKSQREWVWMKKKKRQKVQGQPCSALKLIVGEEGKEPEKNRSAK